ncbi:hypothetical protein QUF72_22865 [Desulfobacterales bacterium HSG2]|nr:hypothetical protein [Desulfobacterales bacterium HSG2]
MTLPYWEYFLSIETDLLRCGRYVEFTEDNYCTYSVEFACIIMAASSEFDTLAKDLCSKIDSTKRVGKITDYYSVIINRYPNFPGTKVIIPRYNLSHSPWSEWNAEERPYWWSKGYNKIKHDRTNNFVEANLKNAIDATAGLFVAILYLYKTSYTDNLLIEAPNAPKLPSVGGASTVITHGAGTYWRYNLA